MRKRFVDLLRDRRGESDGEEARLLSEKVFDFSEFARDVIGLGGEDSAAENEPVSGAVTYHDPCHLRRGMNVSRQPRELIRASGYELVEMADSDVCCGFAGSYSFAYPEISEGILKRKIECIRSAEINGATIVATDCPGCVLQLRGGLDKAGVGMAVRHTAQIVWERLAQSGEADAKEG